MTEEKFAALVGKQMPDAEKRRRADFVVDSSQSFDHARAQVRDIVQEMPGIVLYTLLQENLAVRLEEKCRTLGLPCLSILGPVLHLFKAYLGAEFNP